MNDHEERFERAAAFAARVGVSERRVRTWIAVGRVPTRLLGRSRLIEVDGALLALGLADGERFRRSLETARGEIAREAARRALLGGVTPAEFMAVKSGLESALLVLDAEGAR